MLGTPSFVVDLAGRALVHASEEAVEEVTQRGGMPVTDLSAVPVVVAATLGFGERVSDLVIPEV